MASRQRRTVRAARRRAKQTAANLTARERAQERIAEAEEDTTWRPRVGRHVAQLDHLLTEGAIIPDMARAGHRFARDYERSASMVGRLVGRYEADIIRRPGKGSPPPDTPGTIAARERFEAAVDALGPLWGITFHVAVLDQPPDSWGAPPDRQNGDAMALLRLGLATLMQWYALHPSARAARTDRRLRMKAPMPATVPASA